MAKIKLNVAVVSQSELLMGDILQICDKRRIENISKYETCSEALTVLRSKDIDLVIFDWDSEEIESVVTFLQKMQKAKGTSSVGFIAFVNDISPRITSIAGEYGLSKVFQKVRVTEDLSPFIDSFLKEVKKDDPLKNSFFKLDRAVAKGSQKEIDQVVEELYKNYPQNLRVQMEYATLCLRKGNIEDAEKIAERGRAANPSNLRCITVHARVLMHKKKLNEAFEILKNVDLLSPLKVERLIMMGEVLFEKGQIEESADMFHSALQIDEKSADANLGLAKIELTLGDLNKGLDLIKNVATREEMASLFNTVGISMARRLDYEKAIVLYQMAKNRIEEPSVVAKVLFNIGLAFQKWANYVEAMNHYDEALQLSPMYEKAQLYLQALKARTKAKDKGMDPENIEELAPLDKFKEADIGTEEDHLSFERRITPTAGSAFVKSRKKKVS